MATQGTLLVATDFTDLSLQAMKYGVDLARRLGVSVTCLHVYEIPAYSFFDGAMVATADLTKALADAADGAMRDLVESYRDSGVEVRGLVRVGLTADEVQRAADELDATMIVLGTHGRRGLARAFLGSIAEVVVRTASRPVVVVPFAHAA